MTNPMPIRCTNGLNLMRFRRGAQSPSCRRTTKQKENNTGKDLVQIHHDERYLCVKVPFNIQVYLSDNISALIVRMANAKSQNSVKKMSVATGKPLGGFTCCSLANHL